MMNVLYICYIASNQNPTRDLWLRFFLGVAGGLERSPVCVRCHAVSGAVGALVLPALASGSLRGLVPL